MRTKKMKSKISAFVAFFAVLLGTAAPAWGAAVLQVDASSSNVDLTESFTATVQVNADELYDGADFRVSYDPAKLTLTAVTPGPSWSGAFAAVFDDSVPGQFDYSAVVLNSTLQTPTDVVILSFDANGVAGPAAITLGPRDALATAVITSGGFDITTGVISTSITIGDPVDALFRVNTGGPELPSADGTLPVWSADSVSNPASYPVGFLVANSPGGSTFNGNSGSAHPGPILGGPIGAAPVELFNTERYDPAGAAPILQYSFPIPSGQGAEVEVRLYFAELFNGIGAAGDRVFDVSVEGTVPPEFDDIDAYLEAGPKGAIMRSTTLIVSDGVLDLEFLHGAENPAIKGIEIFEITPGVGNPPPVANDDSDTILLGESTIIDLLDNDIDTDGLAPASIAIVSPPAEGSATPLGDGTVQYVHTGIAGTDTFTYTVEDVLGEISNVATVTITINVPGSPEALVAFTPGGAIEATTFGNDSVQFTNTGEVDITSISVDLSTAVLPDVVFDPLGLAGDSGTKCLTQGSADTAVAVGLTVPANGGSTAADPDCSTPFFVPRDGGFDVMTLTFTDGDGFNPGEQFNFGIDLDPTSIQNDVTSGDAGAIAGLELAGATVTVTFATGETYTSSLFEDGSQGGGQVAVGPGTPAGVPMISMTGATSPSTVTSAAQTIEVVGPALSSITLLQIDARLYIDAGGGGFDIDPFEGNQAVAKVVYTGMTDIAGSLNIPVTLLRTLSSDAGPDAGLNHFVAAVEGAGNGNGLTSNSLVFDFVNVSPVAVADTATAIEGIALLIDVLDNDDPGNAPVTITLDDTGTAGTVSVDDAGTPADPSDDQVLYTPPAGFTGSDSFQYTIEDSDGDVSAAAIVDVTVVPDNAIPDAQDDSATTNEDVAVDIDVLDNDSDADTDPLTITQIGIPANGVAVFNDGALIGDPSDDTITYTPNLNFNGADSFSYTISDGIDSATATVNVTVLPVDEILDAVDDVASTSEDILVFTPDVLLNDLLGELPTTITAFDVSSLQGGQVSAVPNSTTFLYVPPANFSGQDSFTYTITDSVGAVDTATVVVNVASINDAPTASADFAGTNEDSSVVISVLGNDTDIDGDNLTVSAVSTPANGVATTDGNTVTYTPNANYFGTDVFQYTVSDGTTTAMAVITVTIAPVNDIPLAQPDSVDTDEDMSAVISPLGNDTPGDAPTIIVGVGPTAIAGGSVTFSATTVTYTPAPDYEGADSFTYTIEDVDGEQSTATVSVNVMAVNDLPVALDDADTTAEDTPVTVTVLANDNDVDLDPLTVSAATDGSFGTVSSDGTTVTYTPDADFFGGDSFTYTIIDGAGGSATATVMITVTPVNDDPVAVDDDVSTNEEVLVSINVIGNDSDVDNNPLTIASFSAPSNGTVAPNGSTLDYTPNADFVGTDSFTYTLSDGEGGSATATVTVTVINVNDAPEAGADTATTDEDTPISIAVLGNDSDIDGNPLSVVDVTPAANGSVSFGAGDVTYTPNLNYPGPTDTFTYTVADGEGGLATGTVTVTINPVNDAPQAAADSVGTAEETAVLIDVLLNDVDVDGDTLSVTSVGAPGSGSVVISNGGADVTYTPSLNFTGTDSFSYTVSDGNGETDFATVTVLVGAENDAPTAADDLVVTAEDTPVTIAVLTNDDDVDNDPLTVITVETPSSGTATTDGTTVTYTPAPDDNGTVTFNYIISDGEFSDAAAITVTITPVNDAPVAVDDLNESTTEDTDVTIDVLGNDTDVDVGDTLTVDSVVQPANGTVTNNGTNIEYSPDANFTGTDTFTYTVSDGALTDTATVSVTVGAVNDAPVAMNDSAQTDKTFPVVINVLANDTDAENDTLTVDSVTAAANGTVTNNGSDVTYTPDPTFVGTDSFDYTVTDGEGGFDTATVTIDVRDVGVVSTDSYIAANGASVLTTVFLSNATAPAAGAMTVEVHYDETALTPVSCIDNPSNDGRIFTGCNASFAPGIARFTLIAAAGVTDTDLPLASFEFTATGATGDSTPLDVVIQTYTDQQGDPLAAVDDDGDVTIGLLGDVNCDSAVNSIDALFVLQFQVNARDEVLTCSSPGVPLGTLYTPLCDVNGSGSCDVVDALFIQQCEVGIPNSLCPASVFGATESRKSVLPELPAVSEEAAARVVLSVDRLNSEKGLLRMPLQAYVPRDATLGAATIEVQYDDSLLRFEGCTADSAGLLDGAQCHVDKEQGVVRFTGVSIAGLSGKLTLAQLTFAQLGREAGKVDAVVEVFADVDGLPLAFGLGTRPQEPLLQR